MHPTGGRPGTGTSTWWALVAAGLIAYASLYPLTGWNHPAGWNFWRELSLPWPRYATRFDVVSNVLGYVPLGGLLALAFARDRGWPLLPAAVVALLLGAGLSLSMELLQHLLPGRVPSALDAVCNTGGTAIGIVLALPLHASGRLDAWQRRHDRWFRRGSAGGTTLLALWPLALLFPAPVPLGLGQVFEHVGEAMAAWVADTPLEVPVLEALGLGSDVVAAARGRATLGPAAELLLVAASMAVPCLLAFTLTAPGWRRVVLAAGGAAIAVGGLSLSAALNFGPQHAFAWQTPQALAGIGVGATASAALAWVSPRLAAALGLVAVTAAVSLVAGAPTDPYFAVSLAAWEQGRFIRFHGASQWIGWLWPYATAAYLLRQVGRSR